MSAFDPTIATINPAAPAKKASNRLSVINCRTIRPRPAPTAARIAISRVRAVAFASNRVATLAQAISRTKLTAPSSRYKRHPHIAYHVIPHSGYCNTSVFVAVGILMLQPRTERSKLTLRLFQANAWFQAGDREETQAGARQRSVDSIRGTPDIALIRKMESWREDAHDRQRLI